ncbi:MAG: TRAP transporter substrate-binding protein [Deltaproteobacteria bacterium]|nr:TRAP transporter substrate-binding protein [Deltaproteobacteria bacterium]
MKQKRVLGVVLGVAVCVGFLASILFSGMAHAQAVRLKVATYFPAPASQSTLLEEFCRELERRTGGQVKVDFFAGGSLFAPVGTFDAVSRGVGDIGYSHVYYTTGRMPVMEAIGLPLGYPSAWVSGQVMNDFYKQVRPKEFDAVKVLWMNTSPPSAIATSKKPIRRLEDLRGLTIRAPGVAGDVIKALGGTPAPTPMPEVYDAISKGVLDGEASNFETLRTFRFAEVVKYTISVWQITNPFPFYLIMNKDSYAKLPADIKPIFDGLVGEYKEQYIAMWNAVDFVGRDFGVEKGVEFSELSTEEAARWRAAVDPVIEAYVKKMVGAGFTEAEVRGWIKFIRDRIDFWTKKQIALRISSAAGPPELRPRR